MALPRRDTIWLQHCGDHPHTDHGPMVEGAKSHCKGCKVPDKALVQDQFSMGVRFSFSLLLISPLDRHDVVFAKALSEKKH